MKTIRGKLHGQPKGYLHHAIELSFEARSASTREAAAVPFSTRAQASDAGQFVLEVPDDLVPEGSVRIAVFSPAGVPLKQDVRDALLPLSQAFGIDFGPAVTS